MPFLYVNDALAQVGLDPSCRVFGRSMMRRWHRLLAQRCHIASSTRELESYSDNELAELRLTRSDIPMVARSIHRWE